MPAGRLAPPRYGPRSPRLKASRAAASSPPPRKMHLRKKQPAIAIYGTLCSPHFFDGLESSPRPHTWISLTCIDRAALVNQQAICLKLSNGNAHPIPRLDQCPFVGEDHP